LGGTAYLTNCTIADAETVAGTINWGSGVLSQTGSLTVAPNGVLNLAGSGTIQLEGPLTNNGTVNWLSGPVQVLNNNGVTYFGAIWNQPGANWFIQNNGQSLSPYFVTGAEKFHNAGLLSKTNVSGTSYINLYLNNAAGGTVQAQIGTIDFEGFSSDTASASIATVALNLADPAGGGASTAFWKSLFPQLANVTALSFYQDPGGPVAPLVRDPFGAAIERVIIESQFHDLENEILEDPGAIEPWLIRRRRTEN